MTFSSAAASAAVQNPANPVDALFTVDVKVNLAAAELFASLLNSLCFMLPINMNFEGAVNLTQEGICLSLEKHE